jgi:hypothetical protein
MSHVPGYELDFLVSGSSKPDDPAPSATDVALINSCAGGNGVAREFGRRKSCDPRVDTRYASKAPRTP